MDFPNIHGISDIQETQFMTASRTTNPMSARTNTLPPTQLSDYFNDGNQLDGYLSHAEQIAAPSFQELRDYVERTLDSWGFKIGYLTQSTQNMSIIKCFMHLIEQKYKNQEARDQLKKNVSDVVFERNKYQSLLEQERLSGVEKAKNIGRLENIINDYKNKLKSLEQSCKKEKEDDKKMISMLKSKNEQILHEIKKKEQQVARVKDQMKKNVGEKGALKNVNFEVYEVLPKEQFDETRDKLESLGQRYENEKKNLMRENQLLREKLFDIREEIVGFAEWVDSNVFKEEKSNYKNKMIINHNLLFRKESLVAELNEVLENARSGITQVLQMYEDGRKSLISIQNSSKKSQHQGSQNSKQFEQNLTPNKLTRRPSDFAKKQIEQVIRIVPQRKQSSQEDKKERRSAPAFEIKKQSKPVVSNPHLEPHEEEESELSMISHISGNEIISQNKKFEKWDLLLGHEDD